VTSAALTRKLAPHLDGYYDAIYSKTGGNVKKASQEDKYHDIAFQRFAEGTTSNITCSTDCNLIITIFEGILLSSAVLCMMACMYHAVVPLQITQHKKHHILTPMCCCVIYACNCSLL
jgi:hypothetical protein